MASFRPNYTAGLGTRPRHILDESAFNVQSPGQQTHHSVDHAKPKRLARTPSPMLPPKRARLEAAGVEKPTLDMALVDVSPPGNLINALMERGGKIGELTEKHEKLEQQMQQLEAKLQQEQQAKNDEIMKLQQELQQFKALTTVQASSSQRDANQLTTVLKAQAEKSSNLRIQLTDAKARMGKMEETITQQRKQITELTQALASKDVQLQQQRQEAKQQLSRQGLTAQGDVSKLEQALQLQKQATAAERARLEEMQQTYDSVVQQCASMAEAHLQMKAKLAKMEAEQLLSMAVRIIVNYYNSKLHLIHVHYSISSLPNLTAAPDTHSFTPQASMSPPVKSYELQIDILRDQLKDKEDELSQVEKWKEQATQYMVAKEELRIAEQRLEHLQGKLETAQTTNAQTDELKAQIAAWYHYGQEHNISSPQDLTSTINSLKREKDMVIQQAETLRTEWHKAQQEQSSAAVVESQPNTELHQLKHQLKASKESEASAERRARILQEERDGLRRLVASYQDTDDSAAAQAAQAMAKSLAELQDQVEAMLAQLKAAAATERDLQQKLATAVSQKEALESEKQALEKELDRYVEENEKLVARVGRGEYDPNTTKVLQFKFNPEAQAREKELLKLQAEVAALREQISCQGNSDTGGTVPLAEKQAEIVLLQRQVAATEKQMGRLKEVFNVRISAFREACYALFGYRIDMISQPTTMREAATATSTFVLQPHFAADPHAALKFVYTKQRGMEMVPTSFSQRHQQQADVYIKRFKSIPAFTANMTLENFNQATGG